MKDHLLTKVALTLFVLTVSLLAVVLARDVLIPFCISVLFSYLLYPVVWKIERKGVHRILAILLVLVIAIVVIAALIFFVSARITNIEIDLSALKQQFDGGVDNLLRIIEERLGVQNETVEKYLGEVSGLLFSFLQTGAGKIFSATTSTVFQIVLLPVYTFLLLLYRTKSAYFILMLAGRENRGKVLHVLREISTVTTKYLAGILTVVFVLAVLNTIGLTIIGVPHALLFGCFAAVLNLIPYIGTFIGGLVPILYVFFTYEEPLRVAIQVLILFVVIQSLEGNFLTPKIVGNSIRINALAIIIALLAGNLIWGMAGMLVAVPVLAIMKIVMQNFDELKPFAFLISDEGMTQYDFRIRWKWFRKIRERSFLLLEKRKGNKRSNI